MSDDLSQTFGVANGFVDGRDDRLNQFAMGGRSFGVWGSSIAIDTYVMLAEQFGWESYAKVIKEYNSVPTISDNTQKLNEWAKRYSKAVGKNVCPYFKWFSWPLTKETEAECAKLPAWETDILKKYTRKNL